VEKWAIWRMMRISTVFFSAVGDILPVVPAPPAPPYHAVSMTVTEMLRSDLKSVPGLLSNGPSWPQSHAKYAVLQARLRAPVGEGTSEKIRMKKLFGTRIALWAETPNDLAQLRIPLLHLGCEVLQAESFAQLGVWVKSHAIGLIVTVLSADDQRAFELITWLDEIPDAPPVLFAGRALDVDSYLEVMRRGAFDCIGLPLDEYELARIVAAAFETASLRQPA
jgi:hypothetical protein